MINTALNKIGYETSPNAGFWAKTAGVTTLCSVAAFTLAGTAAKAHRWFLSGAGFTGALSLGGALATPQEKINAERTKDLYVESVIGKGQASEITRICILFGAGSLVGALVCYPIGRYLMARPVALLTGLAAGLVGGFGMTTTIRCAVQPKTERSWWPW